MPKITMICCGCGVEVQKYKCQLHGNIVFCSLSCRNKNYSNANPAWKPANYKGPVERVCNKCNNIYLVERSKLNTNKHFCSRSCHTAAQINVAPFAMTDEIRSKISIAQVNHCKEFGNQFVTGKSQGRHTVETAAKISQSNAGKAPIWKGRIFQYLGPKGKFKMRSSYELFYANWMDAHDIHWEYEPKFTLSNGKVFQPDFRLLDGTIIEVKGYWAPVGKLKWEMFCQEFPDLKRQVLMKQDLVTLGMNRR